MPTSEHVTALFEEHRNPTHCSRQKVHSSLAPVAELILAIQRQIAAYRTHLMRAELLAVEDERLDGKYEMLHQTLGSIEQESTVVFASLRRLAGSTLTFERHMNEAETEIAKKLSKRSPNALTG